MVDVDATFTTSLAGSPTLTSGTGRLVSAVVASALVGSVSIEVVRSRTVEASVVSSLEIFADLEVLAGQVSRTVNGAVSSSLTASVNLSGASDRRGRTVCELVNESLSLWGFLCSANAPKYAFDRAITDLNTALQLVWNNAEGRDYWSSEEITVPLADGESSYVLADNIQNVVGPCRRADNSRPLTPVGSVGELETFVDTYLNGETYDEPIAYHIDRMRQTATDPAKCVFRVVPPVFGASISFLLDVIKECPRYTVDDLTSCPLVPIPHQYAETLLIPIIRYHASSYFLFASADAKQKETIDREYAQAMASLGYADPNPVKEKSDKRERGDG